MSTRPEAEEAWAEMLKSPGEGERSKFGELVAPAIAVAILSPRELPRIILALSQFVWQRLTGRSTHNGDGGNQ